MGILIGSIPISAARGRVVWMVFGATKQDAYGAYRYHETCGNVARTAWPTVAGLLARNAHNRMILNDASSNSMAMNFLLLTNTVRGSKEGVLGRRRGHIYISPSTGRPAICDSIPFNRVECTYSPAPAPAPAYLHRGVCGVRSAVCAPPNKRGNGCRYHETTIPRYRGAEGRGGCLSYPIPHRTRKRIEGEREREYLPPYLDNAAQSMDGQVRRAHTLTSGQGMGLSTSSLLASAIKVRERGGHGGN